uniref:Nitrilase 1 n=1 Tax=Pavo cristatus TaxID=9049 RepID=A0A8C9G5J8_PAVCR
MAVSLGPKPLVAVGQVTSTPDKEQNFSGCAALVRAAARQGACLVFLPEGFDYIGRDSAQTLSLVSPTSPAPLRGPVAHPSAPSAPLSLAGRLAAAYRKTHLCDVELEGRVTMKESSFTNPAMSCVCPDCPLVPDQLGLSICYDLRFPEISLALRHAGAEILTYPSAFTFPTGSAHWEVLLRARAIETQCYVVAAAQTGRNHEGRMSYGHTLVADPWGTVVAQCSEGPGLCYAEIDLEYLHRVRREIPVQSHRRADLYGTVGKPKATQGI